MEIPAEHASNVFGEFDSYLKKIEKTLQVETVERNGELKITGSKERVDRAVLILKQLLELSRRKNVIHEQNVDYLLSLTEPEKTEAYVEMDKSCICHTIQGKPVKPKTFGQKKICGGNSEKQDRFWYRTGGYRQNLPCHGHGDHRLSKR